MSGLLTRNMFYKSYYNPMIRNMPLAFIRQLQESKLVASACEELAGNTYRAWVALSTVLKQATSVVQQLGIVGPCNVQLRLTDRGAIPFEINPRFSGTTGMRANFVTMS